MKNKYYIYTYLDPRKPGQYKYEEYEFDYEPFYIGKGSGNRYKNLTNRSKYFKNKINKIKKCGLEVISIKLYENLSESKSFLLESKLISLIGRKDVCIGSLINFTNGGEGSSGYIHTERSKNKISEKKKGIYIGKNNPFFGKHHIKETKEKISEKLKKDFQYIKNEFEKRKYVLLTIESEYKNCHRKLKYICPEGHEGYMSWGNFKQGYGCPIEGQETSNKKQKRRNFSDIKNEFEKIEYIILTKEEEYKNAHCKLEYINKFGEIKVISWHHFQQKYKIII